MPPEKRIKKDMVYGHAADARRYVTVYDDHTIFEKQNPRQEYSVANILINHPMSLAWEIGIPSI